MSTQDPQRLATLPEMAERLRVPRAWLKAEAEAGRIPSLQAGSRILFDPEVVEPMLRARAAQREQEVPDAS